MMDSRVARNSGRHSFSSAVGRGSKSHDFDHDRRMISSTSSIVAEGNSVSGKSSKKFVAIQWIDCVRSLINPFWCCPHVVNLLSEKFAEWFRNVGIH